MKLLVESGANTNIQDGEEVRRLYILQGLRNHPGRTRLWPDYYLPLFSAHAQCGMDTLAQRAVLCRCRSKLFIGAGTGPAGLAMAEPFSAEVET